MGSHGNMKTASGRGEMGKTTNRTAQVYKMARRPESKLKEKEPCRACGEAHHLEKCKVFSGWSTEKKWEAAK